MSNYLVVRLSAAFIRLNDSVDIRFFLIKVKTSINT